MLNEPYGESMRYVPAATPLALMRIRMNVCGGDPAPFGNAASSANAVETAPPPMDTSLETPRQYNASPEPSEARNSESELFGPQLMSSTQRVSLFPAASAYQSGTPVTAVVGPPAGRSASGGTANAVVAAIAATVEIAARVLRRTRAPSLVLLITR